MRVAVIGAGPAGITAAYQLAKGGAQVEVFEAGAKVGGLSRSIDLWGQKVDLGPHRFFSQDPRVNQLWLEVVGRDYRMVDRLTRIYYRRRYFEYPLKPVNALWNMGVTNAAQCLSSYLKEKLHPSFTSARNETFESWVVGRFGRRLFDMFFKPYSEKLWGISCDALDADFAAQRIKKFSLGQAVKAALGIGKNNHKTLVEQFAYPTGGTGMVYERMANRVEQLGGQVHLNQAVGRVVHQKSKVQGLEFADRRFQPFDHVISTMPLTLLVRGLGNMPAAVEEGVAALRFRNTILVYLNVAAADLFKDQWLYIHSPDLGMGRVTNFRNWVPELYGASPNSILALEYWCNDEDSQWRENDSALIERGEREMRATGMVGNARILDGKVTRIRRCYPVYARGYKQHLDPVVAYLRGFQGLSAIGRYGAFKYNNQDHSILMGLLAAENILENREHDLWAVNTDATYQESAIITKTGLDYPDRRPARPDRWKRPPRHPRQCLNPQLIPMADSAPLSKPYPWPLRILGLEPRKLVPLEIIALLATFLLSFIALLVSLQDVSRYAGIDFRNRVVGARVLLTGQDPYTFCWQPGMPLELLDPCHDDKVHRLTAPPPTLFLYAAIASLAYPVQRLVSCLLEWLALTLSIVFLARTIADQRQRVLFLLAAVLFFMLSGFWRMHVERGQVYVFHLLLLSGAATLCLRGHLNSWSAGILFGIASLMRPNYLLMAPAFLILRQWKTGLGTTFTFILGALATLPFMHPDGWHSYLHIGDQYYLALWAPELLPMRPPPAFEGLVEGVDFSRLLHDLTSTSFAVFYQAWQQQGVFPVIDLGVASKGILGLLVLALLGLLGGGRHERLPPRATVALIACFALDTDFFLPHRWGYVDVMLLLPLALLWPVLWEDRTSSKVTVAALLVGFIGGICLVPQLTLYYATLLRSWVVMGSLTGLAVAKWPRRGEDSVVARMMRASAAEPQIVPSVQEVVTAR